jgi:hypothetical protein
MGRKTQVGDKVIFKFANNHLSGEGVITQESIDNRWIIRLTREFFHSGIKMEPGVSVYIHKTEVRAVFVGWQSV